MINDTSLVKTLNLPRTSPSFAYRQLPDGSLNVVNPKAITEDGSIYWVAGTTALPRGKKTIPSVFVIENGGENLLAVYWYITDCWFRSDDPDAIDALELPKDQVFPFDWSYAIPVSNDPFHS